MSKIALVKDAATAWNHLHGIMCVYKPKNITIHNLIKDVKSLLCKDLNSMVCREPQTVVQFRRLENGCSESQTSLTVHDPGKEIVGRIQDGPDIIEIIKCPSYADHPLVVGPRYQRQDLKLISASYIGRDSSGIALLGMMSEGGNIARRILQSRWIRAYIVSGRFGTATETQFHTGKIVEKSTFHHIKKYLLDRLLSSSQASHQRTMFQAAGVQLNSDRAYELASQGLVRPDDSSEPVIYSLKCIKFDLPDFEIEMQVVNENEDYLKTLIHEFGIRLRSTATCTKIRCIKYGPFNLDHALLKKHWDVENTIANLYTSAQVLKTVDTWVRDPLIVKNTETEETSSTSSQIREELANR